MGAVRLRYRVDADGHNDPATDVNEVYNGGAGVGPWVDVAMNKRVFPKGNVTNDPEINSSILPGEIADEYWVKVEGLASVLVDYYVEATDGVGQVTRSDIQHVWIGDGVGAAPPSDGRVSPSAPCRDDLIVVRGDRAGWVHWGIDGWTRPDEALWPEGTVEFSDGKAVETPLVACGDALCATLGPFGAGVSTLDFVFRYADGSWDNNGGQDWHVPIAATCAAPGEDTSSGDPDAGSTDATQGPDAAGPDGGADDVGGPGDTAGAGARAVGAAAGRRRGCPRRPWGCCSRSSCGGAASPDARRRAARCPLLREARQGHEGEGAVVDVAHVGAGDPCVGGDGVDAAEADVVAIGAEVLAAGGDLEAPVSDPGGVPRHRDLEVEADHALGEAAQLAQDRAARRRRHLVQRQHQRRRVEGADGGVGQGAGDVAGDEAHVRDALAAAAALGPGDHRRRVVHADHLGGDARDAERQPAGARAGVEHPLAGRDLPGDDGVEPPLQRLDHAPVERSFIVLAHDDQNTSEHFRTLRG